MAKAKAKVNEKTLEVLTKTKKDGRRGPKPKAKKEQEAASTQRARSRSRSRTPSRAAKTPKPLAIKSEPKKPAGRKPKAANNVAEPKSEPIVKRLEGEVKKKRAPRKAAVVKNNSTPRKKPQEATPLRKQPRRIAAINSGNSYASHKMDTDYVDSPITVDFNQGEAGSVNTGGGWFSRCSIV